MDRIHQYKDDDSIDTLYKAMELAEPLPKPDSPRFDEVSSMPVPRSISTTNNHANPPPSSSSDPNYIAVDASILNRPNPQSPMQEAEERAFIWELLEFARKRNWKKKLLTIMIILCSVYVITDLIFYGRVVEIVNAFLSWMTQQTVWAVFACIFFFAAATLLFVPHAILTFGAGWAFANVCGFWWGLMLGLFVSFMGSSLGAILSFLRSRYMMRDLIELFAQRFPIVKAADRAIERKGFKIMLLLRLCPIIPFNGLNYLGGVTSCSLEEYTKALIGILPITLLWSTVGASADQISNRETDDTGEQVFLVILLFFGFFCGVAGLSRIYKYARDELRKEIEFDRAESWKKYKRSTSSNLTSSSTPPDEQNRHVSAVDEGIEVLNRADLTLLAVLGVDGFSVEAQRPPENEDEDDPFWYWA